MTTDERLAALRAQKVLSLTQPWASLVAIGAKQIETRSWATSYRGPLLIHAAKGLGPVGGERGLVDICRSEPFHSALLAGIGEFGTWNLPRGAIIAACDLSDCRATAGLRNEGTGPKYADWVHSLSSQERAFGDYTPGRYGWLLLNARALPEPIPAKGALGLWEWEGELPL